MSGGSSSLLTIPSWLALGFPLPVAVGADKVAGTAWTLLGARNYLAAKPIDLRLIAGMVIVGVVGAYLGTRVTTSVDPAILTRLVGGFILLAVLAVAWRPQIGSEQRPARFSRGWMNAAALPLGFYEGLLGSGNSIAVTLLLVTGRGFDLLSALGHYYAIAAAWGGFAAAAYYFHGDQRLVLAVPAALGAMGGGYLGSRIGSRRGLKFVRVVFILAGLVLGMKLVAGL